MQRRTWDAMIETCTRIAAGVITRKERNSNLSHTHNFLTRCLSSVRVPNLAIHNDIHGHKRVIHGGRDSMMYGHDGAELEMH